MIAEIFISVFCGVGAVFILLGLWGWLLERSSNTRLGRWWIRRHDRPTVFSNFMARCEHCGATRPHAEIDVLQSDLSELHELPAGTVTRNYNYCRAHVVCKLAARQRWKSDQKRNEAEVQARTNRRTGNDVKNDTT